MDYVREVAKLQKAAGLEKWFEGVLAMKAINDRKMGRRT
jgi:hypothetical protein